MASIPSWPDRLPVPRIDGYAYQRSSPFVRSAMDSGLARQRRRFTKVPTSISVVWRISVEQLELFEGFVLYELKGGTSWFATTVANGLALNTVRGRFSDSSAPYKIALVSDTTDFYDVTATLEVIDMPADSLVGYSAIAKYGLRSEFLRRGERWHRFINNTRPDTTA